MSLHVVVLGTGRGSRRLDPRRSQPAALVPVGGAGPVLDWLLHALREHAGPVDVTYVGGYHIEKVVERYPELRFRYHREWEREGELGALRLASAGGPRHERLLVVRADTVILPEAIRRLLAAGDGNVAAVHGTGRQRPFAGLLLLQGPTVAALDGVLERVSSGGDAESLDALVQFLRHEGDVADLNLEGFVSPLDDRVAVARTVFRGKGHALDHLGKVARSAQVLDLLRVPVARWEADPEAVLRDVGEAFGGHCVIVRSSAAGEDDISSSGAGLFRTEPGIQADDPRAVSAAIASVISTYTTRDRPPASADEVLIQPQLSDVSMSGVMFTRDLTTGAPYFVLTVDTTSGRADVVTSGSGDEEVATHYVLWGSGPPAGLPYGDACLQLASEIVDLTGIDALDIEFAFAEDGTGYLLQARPMASLRDVGRRSDDDFLDLVARAREFVADRMAPEPLLAGRQTVFGAMPDWNPAEMIGRAPRPLALSLYQRLIGDYAWAEARHRLGYRDARPQRLVVSIAGSPYVDVRASVNSLLPAGLPGAVEEVWVDACLDRLRADPTLHDKIEFDLLPTCVTANIDDWAFPRMREAGLRPRDVEDYRGRLVALTTGLVSGTTEPIAAQLALIHRLGDRRAEIFERMPVTDPHRAARRAALLLDDCTWYGTVPFAVLARYAFVGLAILRSLEECGVLHGDDLADLLRCVPTVAGELAADMAAFADGQRTTEDMVHRYGHLRPGSYEITAPRYGSHPERFLRPATAEAYVAPDMTADVARKRLVQQRGGAIERALTAVGLDVPAPVIVEFAQQAIAARERAKFEFMKTVDAALETLADVGSLAGLDREQMSFVPVDLLLRLSSESTTDAVAAQLLREIGFQQKRWELTCALRLPDVIREPEEVQRFTHDAWRPNFVTRKRIEAPLVHLADGVDPFAGCVVVIESADPGHDWIFGYGIGGLITKYGGAASHMAIRAAEFSLPAAIGCGETIYAQLRGARRVELDCENGRVRGIA